MVLIAVVTLLAANPQTGLTIAGIKPLFGLDPATGEDARITGPIAAIWYLLFILPMFLLTPDADRGLPFGAAIRSGLAELKTTLRELRDRPVLLRFLIARMLYQDGVNGVLILGGVFAAGMFGWATMEIGLFGILLNVVAIVGCFAAGRVDQKLGSRITILISLVLLLIATVGIVSTEKGSTLFGWIQLPTADNGGIFATGAEKAYLLYGILIGLAFGPVQASSRSYLARNITIAEAGRYFGIYALSGRATGFMATLSLFNSNLPQWLRTHRHGHPHRVSGVGVCSVVARPGTGSKLKNRREHLRGLTRNAPASFRADRVFAAMRAAATSAHLFRMHSACAFPWAPAACKRCEPCIACRNSSVLRRICSSIICNGAWKFRASDPSPNALAICSCIWLC